MRRFVLLAVLAACAAPAPRQSAPSGPPAVDIDACVFSTGKPDDNFLRAVAPRQYEGRVHFRSVRLVASAEESAGCQLMIAVTKTGATRFHPAYGELILPGSGKSLARFEISGWMVEKISLGVVERLAPGTEARAELDRSLKGGAAKAEAPAPGASAPRPEPAPKPAPAPAPKPRELDSSEKAALDGQL